MSYKDLRNDEAVKCQYQLVMKLLNADRMIGAEERLENMALCNEMWMELNKTMNQEFSEVPIKSQDDNLFINWFNGDERSIWE